MLSQPLIITDSVSGESEDKIIAYKMRLMPKQLWVKIIRVADDSENKTMEIME